jgi:hypothetical protein
LPLRATRPRSGTNEYVRHGTQSLLAALEVATGRVIGHVRDRRTSVNFLRFMNDVVAAFPHRGLHVVLDSLNIHKNAAAQRWLERHPTVHFHHTPTHASWVNLIECFFSILGKQALSQRVDPSKRSLRAFLLEYLDHYNDSSAPFTWTKGPEKLQRIIEATKAYQDGHPPKRRRRTHRRKANNIKHYIRTVAEPIDENARKAAVFEEVHTYTPAIATGAPGSDWTHMRVFRLKGYAALDRFSQGMDEATRRVVPDAGQRSRNSQRAADLRDLVRQEIWEDFR